MDRGSKDSYPAPSSISREGLTWEGESKDAVVPVQMSQYEMWQRRRNGDTGKKRLSVCEYLV